MFWYLFIYLFIHSLPGLFAYTLPSISEPSPSVTRMLIVHMRDIDTKIEVLSLWLLHSIILFLFVKR